ncbi:MAG: MarR family transcriptional regulator [Frankiales bacterium]|nr:MarR family transcriptional regulator [Frankiales bacterium]
MPEPGEPDAVPAPRWLDDEELAAWLPLVRVLTVLPQQLDRQLREQAGIKHVYYMIMVLLSEAPDRTLPLSALAKGVGMIPSRLTHALGSLESRGWTERLPSPTDRRVQLARLTDAGMHALEAAAPGHVAEVRRTVVDVLTRRDLQELRRIAGRIAAALEEVED